MGRVGWVWGRMRGVRVVGVGACEDYVGSKVVCEQSE